MVFTIVVPLDTSPFGEHALPWARAVANHSHADANVTLHLVHVHVPVYRTGLGAAAVGTMPRVDDQLDDACRRSEAQYLQGIHARLRTVTGLNVRSAVLDGPVAPTVAQYAKEMNADLIVMTTHGRGGVARMWLGNVADALLRHGGVPVVVIRPPAQLSTPAPAPAIRRILIPLDGSPLAEQVLQPACAVGDRFGASYLLLHVFTAFPPGGYAAGVDAVTLRQIEQRERAEMQAYLNGIAERLRAAGRDVAIEIRSEEQPAPAILQTAHQHGVDLLVLATHGHSGVRRWLLGSVADKVVRAADMPVLLHHPQAQ